MADQRAMPAMEPDTATVDGALVAVDVEGPGDLPLWDAADDVTSEGKEEARRARHREVQRRFAQRKKERIRQDRLLVQRLESRFKLLSTVAERQQLANDNAAMVEACLAFTLSSPPKRVVHSVVQSQMEIVREHYQPLTTAQWAELLRLSLEDYEGFQRRGQWHSTGATVLGWRDRISTDDGSLQFAMEKDFVHLDAHDFAELAWQRLSSPEHHRRLFSHGLVVKMQVLQRINADAVVINRCIYNPRTSTVGHTMELFCRVLRGRDSVVLARSLESTRAQQSVSFHCGRQFPQLMGSFLFARRPSGGCRFRYSCWVRDFVAAGAAYWATELPTMLWRFESVMVAPAFALRVGEEDPDS